MFGSRASRGFRTPRCRVARPRWGCGGAVAARVADVTEIWWLGSGAGLSVTEDSIQGTPSTRSQNLIDSNRHQLFSKSGSAEMLQMVWRRSPTFIRSGQRSLGDGDAGESHEVSCSRNTATWVRQLGYGCLWDSRVKQRGVDLLPNPHLEPEAGRIRFIQSQCRVHLG